MNIFISYSNRDGDAVRTLAQDLVSGRQSVWLDQDLTGGDVWWRTILERIRSCSVFVLALTDHSLASEPCRAELAYARSLGIPVLPVQVGHVTSLRTVSVSEIQIVDYRERTASAGITLLNAVTAHAGRARRLPDPLPAPPPIPYEYLILLSQQITSTQPMPPGDQLAVVTQLGDRLRRVDEDSVRRDIHNLLDLLRDRPDVTYRTVTEINAIRGAGGQAQPPRPQTSDHRADEPQAARPEVGRPPATGGQRGPAWSIAAFVIGPLALIGPMFVVGLFGIVAAVVGRARHEKGSGWALGVAITGTVIGGIVYAVLIGR